MQLSSTDRYLTAARPALRATPAYWVTMLAASALGTNLGDWFSHGALGAGAGFAILAGTSLAAIAAYAARGLGFWLAIVMLRAAATNIGDGITHSLGLGFVVPSILLAVLTLVAGAATRPGPDSPLIDLRYWLAMLIAGVFGTIAGDYAAEPAGPLAAAAVLVVLTAAAVAWRRARPGSVVWYWAVVLVERCAGTPVGDGLAFRHGFNVGLPVSMLCMLALMTAGLVAVRRGR